jgi:hypothetical protein
VTGRRPWYYANMRTHLRAVLAGVIGVVGFGLLAGAGGSGGSLRLRVEALSTLNDLSATRDQLQGLQKLAQGAAAAPVADGKLNKDYRAALVELESALTGGDDSKIDAAQEKVEDLEEKLTIEDVDTPDPTDTARRRAAEAVKLFSASQIAEFVASYAEEIADPVKTITDALDLTRGSGDADFEELQKETVEQVAVLVNGDPKGAIGPKVDDLLARARKMSDDDFKAKKADLAAEAKRLAGKVDPIEVIRHWVTNSMAELLSNPELGAAIDGRLKALG